MKELLTAGQTVKVIDQYMRNLPIPQESIPKEVLPI